MSTVQDSKMDQRDRLERPDDLPDPADEADRPGSDVIVMFAVFFEGGLAPLSLLLGWWLGHSPLARFSWSLSSVLWGLAAAVPPVVLFLVMLRWPLGPLAKIKSFCEEELIPMMAGCTLSDMALIALSAGVGEEMLFRGVLQGALGGWLGDGWGLVISGVLFGLVHPINLPYIGVTMALGVYLGGLYAIEGNLLTVMVVHALYDFTLMAYLLRVTYRGEPLDPIAPVDSDQDIDGYRGDHW